MRYVWAIAAGLILALGFGFVDNKDRAIGMKFIQAGLHRSKSDMSVIADQLRIFERNHGRYPSTEEGLFAIRKQLTERKAEHRLRLTQSGILSPWGEPYIYENRNGKSATAFTAFEPEQDGAGNYSTKVDRGVYVWSLAAKQKYDVYSYWQPLLNLGKATVLVLAFLCLICYFTACHRRIPSYEIKLSKAFAYISSSLGGLLATVLTFMLLFPITLRSCYEWSAYWMREPKLTKDYMAMIRKYRDNGAISERAYNKLLNALEEDEEPTRYY